MAGQFTIVGLGESLFDIFPGRQFLGGSPLNAAVHAHQLAKARGGCGVLVSRIGQDDLGGRVLEELRCREMDTTYVQTDPDHGTGRVFVSIDEQGQPEYELVEDVAWDWIQWDPDLDDLARRCEALVFSTVAQRHNQSRGNILRFCAEARHAMRLFDPNLRKTNYDARMLKGSCELATLIKLNREELDILSDQLGLPGEGADNRAAALLRQFDLKLVALTRGAEGTVIYTPTQRCESEPVSYVHTENADSVGAGDACTAAILVGMVSRLPIPKIVELANHAGAFVASVRGATPALPESILERLK